MATSTGSPCAACKFLRRKCTPECVFAPYFPSDSPQKFANVHKIFGASNVSKLLNELPLHQREDAVNSLAYEADARVKDPVYGCVGAISILQRRVAQLQAELAVARSELSRYTTINISEPLLPTPPPPPPHQPPNILPTTIASTPHFIHPHHLHHPTSSAQADHIAHMPDHYTTARLSSTAPPPNNNVILYPIATPILGFHPPHTTLKPHNPTPSSSNSTTSRTSSGTFMGHFKLEP